jgi:hypothetical protein
LKIQYLFAGVGDVSLYLPSVPDGVEEFYGGYLLKGMFWREDPTG